MEYIIAYIIVVVLWALGMLLAGWILYGKSL
jgi:hypothetical protein